MLLLFLADQIISNLCVTALLVDQLFTFTMLLLFLLITFSSPFMLLFFVLIICCLPIKPVFFLPKTLHLVHAFINPTRHASAVQKRGVRLARLSHRLVKEARKRRFFEQARRAGDKMFPRRASTKFLENLVIDRREAILGEEARRWACFGRGGEASVLQF